MTLNVELLEKTMAYIETHPEEHDQAAWVTPCGTAFCFAGQAAILAGAVAPTREQLESGMPWCVHESLGISTAASRSDGYVYVDNYAKHKLGLSTGQAYALFDGGNSVTDLRTMVDALKMDPEISEPALYDTIGFTSS